MSWNNKSNEEIHQENMANQLKSCESWLAVGIHGDAAVASLGRAGSPAFWNFQHMNNTSTPCYRQSSKYAERPWHIFPGQLVSNREAHWSVRQGKFALFTSRSTEKICTREPKVHTHYCRPENCGDCEHLMNCGTETYPCYQCQAPDEPVGFCSVEASFRTRVFRHHISVK